MPELGGNTYIVNISPGNTLFLIWKRLGWRVGIKSVTPIGKGFNFFYNVHYRLGKNLKSRPHDKAPRLN